MLCDRFLAEPIISQDWSQDRDVRSYACFRLCELDLKRKVNDMLLSENYL